MSLATKFWKYPLYALLAPLMVAIIGLGNFMWWFGERLKRFANGPLYVGCTTRDVWRARPWNARPESDRACGSEGGLE